MKQVMALSVAAMLALSLPLVPTAQAAGCLRGAMAGGVAGHVLGHHGWLGAGVGCAIGHHEAAKRDREQQGNYYNNRY